MAPPQADYEINTNNGGYPSSYTNGKSTTANDGVATYMEKMLDEGKAQARGEASPDEAQDLTRSSGNLLSEEDVSNIQK